MPTCQKTIQNKIENNEIDTITMLNPNTLFPIFINFSQKQLFKLEIGQQETAQFTISLVSETPPSNISVTITIYQLINNTILLLGSVLVTEMIMSFQKDFSPGTYIICIGSSYSTFTGTFIGDFTGYQIYAKLVPLAYTGQSVNDVDLTFSYVEKKCNKLLYFDITDGNLPEGLQMTLTGDIWGILPNLDCTEETAMLSPSINWYYQMDETWQPWGNQWRFKIKVWIAELPLVSTEEWFCIRIHNNWSWDRDNHFNWNKDEPLPIEYEENTIEEISTPPLPEQMCYEEEAVKPAFTPQPISLSLCPCETESTMEQSTVLNFLQWYENVLKNPPEDNPHIQQFIDNFKKSSYFKTLIEQFGLEDDLLSDEEKELRSVQNIINYYTNQLVENRGKNDVDTIVLSLKEQENQKLPITIVTTSGTYLTVDELK